MGIWLVCRIVSVTGFLSLDCGLGNDNGNRELVFKGLSLSDLIATWFFFCVGFILLAHEAVVEGVDRGHGWWMPDTFS